MTVNDVETSESKIKVVALLGSPRRNGNTHVMACKVLEGASEEGAIVESIFLDDYCIYPTGALSDKKEERADTRQNDDYFKVFERFIRADLVVWASPVYWQGVTSQMKLFCDGLSLYFKHPRYGELFRDKNHVSICAFERSESFHHIWVTQAISLLAEYTGGQYLGEVYAPNTYEWGAVKNDSITLSRCTQLGRACVEKIRKMT